MPRKSASDEPAVVILETEFAGNCSCLGWCNAEFYSPDKRTIRYCKKCREKKNSEQLKLPRIRTSSASDPG